MSFFAYFRISLSLRNEMYVFKFSMIIQSVVRLNIKFSFILID